MESLHKRLDPKRDEVLEFTRTYGRFRAMNRFGVNDYYRFSLWLEEVTHDKDYGLNPVLGLKTGQTLGEQLVAAFLRKVADLETKLAERNERIEFLEWQLSRSGEKEDQQALAILEACQA